MTETKKESELVLDSSPTNQAGRSASDIYKTSVSQPSHSNTHQNVRFLYCNSCNSLRLFQATKAAETVQNVSLQAPRILSNCQ